MKLTASQVMTRDVLSVGLDWPMERLLDFLVDHSISGAPVVADDHRPVGVVSLTDVARNGALPASREVPAYYRAGLDRTMAREEMRAFHVDAPAETTVQDLMTPVVFSVEEDAPVQEVAEAMITGRIHRVFVTRKGKMIGVISAMDLLPIIRDM